MISYYVAIGVGGALGAVARVSMAKLLPVAILGVPSQILLVNVLGCFIMGLLTQMIESYWSLSDNMRYFLTSGFLGGFTTFSTFALEFGVLFQKNEYISAITYALLSVILGITCFFIGIKIVKICL